MGISMQSNAHLVTCDLPLEPGGIDVDTIVPISETQAGQTIQVFFSLTTCGQAAVSVTIPDPSLARVVSGNSFTFSNFNRERGTHWDGSHIVTISLSADLNNDYVTGPREFEIVFAVTGGTANYLGGVSTTVTVTISDDEVAGYTVTPAAYDSILEGIEIPPVTVVLDEKPDPSADVTMTIASQHTDVVTLAGSGLLTFTSVNWNEPQFVTIASVDDDVDNGLQDFNINVAVLSSGGGYDTLAAQTRTGTVIDNDGGDLPGLTITPTMATITENSFVTGAIFTMALEAEPEVNVTIHADYDFGELFTFTGVDDLVFTPGNWAVKQEFSLFSVGNEVVNNNDIEVVVTFSVTPDSDTAYQILDAQEVIVTVIDNEIPGFTLNPPTGSTFAIIDIGAQRTFTAKLDASPEVDVTLSVSSDDIGPNAIMVEPILLTFTTTDWARNQTITVTAVGDATPDYTIDIDVVPSSNLGFASLPGQSLSGTVAIPPSGLVITGPRNVQLDDPNLLGLPVLRKTEQKYPLKLTKTPPGNVTFTIDVTEDDGTTDVSNKIRVTPAQLVFSPTNWAQAQTVTVAAVDNQIDEGKKSYEISINIEDASTYPGYLDITEFIYVSVIDHDQAGISPSSIDETTEGGNSVAFDLRAGSIPTAPVTVTVVSSNEAIAEPRLLLPAATGETVKITVSGTPLTSTVAAVIAETTRSGIVLSPPLANGFIVVHDNTMRDGDQAYEILYTTSSADPLYDGLTASGHGIVRDDEGGPDLTQIIETCASNRRQYVEGSSFGACTTVTGDVGGSSALQLVYSLSSTEHATIDPPNQVYRPRTSDRLNIVTVAFTDNDYVSSPKVVILTVSVGAGPSVWTSLEPLLATLTINDNEDADYTLVPPLNSILPEIAEGGSGTFFALALDVQPEPGVDVTATITHTGPGAVEFTPTALTYSSTNWAQAQTVSVAAMVDAVADPAQDYAVEVSISAGPSPYVALSTKRLVGRITSDDPGFTLTPPTGSILPILAEGVPGGSQTTFTVVLNSQPASDVTMALTNSAPLEATVSSAELTFTSANWHEAQTVTVSAVDDQIAGITADYDIAISVATGPTNYSSLAAQQLSGVVTDDDQAGVAVSISGGSEVLTIEEGGPAGSFTVALAAEPASDVAVSVTSSDETIATVSPAVLNFSPTTWRTAQQIAVTPVDDLLYDGPQEFKVSVAVTSGPSVYTDLATTTLSGIVIDNEVASFTIVPASLEPLNEGETTTISIALGSSAGAEVTVTIASSDRSEGTVVPDELTFTAANATTPQDVVVTGVDDDLVDGDQNFTLTVSAPAGPGNYATLQVTVAGMVTDNEIPGITTDPPAATGLGTIAEGFNEHNLGAVRRPPGRNSNVVGNQFRYQRSYGRSRDLGIFIRPTGPPPNRLKSARLTMAKQMGTSR